MQISLFDGTKAFKITKPIRLITLFSGYDSQALALKYLNIPFEHYRTCEWAVKSIQALKDLHFENDNTDYSKDFSDEFILSRLEKWGISANYNEPMTREQIKRLGTAKQRQIYNNIRATRNLVNIQQVSGQDLGIVDTDKYDYLLTYSFPCQDLSKAGLGKGMAKGSSTRSGMLWEVERILDECEQLGNLPQILLMENVPDVIGSKNISHFAKWLEKLESLGYKCYWKVLNSKDYGVPQNRERCFMVSVLGDYYYDFPQPIPLDIRLKNILEKEVDEKYYLSNKALQGAINTTFCSSKLENKIPKNGVVPTLCARDYKDPKCVVEPKLIELTSNQHQGNRVYDTNGLSVSLCANGGGLGAKTGLYAVTNNLKTQLCNELIANGKVKENDVIRHSYSTSRMNGDKKDIQANNICPTLDTRCDCLGVVVRSTNQRLKRLIEKMDLSQDNQFLDMYNQRTSDKAGTITTRVDASGNTAVYSDYRIRKLTPKECFRLMGVKDKDFEKIAKNQSNASLYHLAGDSIVVDVLMAIFKQMIWEEKHG